MAMSAVYRSKFAALHRQWWYLQMSEKFSIGTQTPTKNTPLPPLKPKISLVISLYL